MSVWAELENRGPCACGCGLKQVRRIRFYAGLLLPSSIRICMDIDDHNRKLQSKLAKTKNY
jgi:hypothetical protein